MRTQRVALLRTRHGIETRGSFLVEGVSLEPGVGRRRSGGIF